MTEFKGTKRKWNIEGTPYLNEHSKENDGSFDIRNQRRTLVCQCSAYSFFGIKSIEEAHYNALLISKAPEMLKMLKYLIKDDQLSSASMTKQVINLIKEATEL